jgi:hypothetical protein
MDKPINNKELIHKFTEEILNEYEFSEVTEEYGDDKTSAAQEIRREIAISLGCFDTLPIEQLARVLTRFKEMHPHGEDLDKTICGWDARTLSHSINQELYKILEREMLDGLDPFTASAIQHFVVEVAKFAGPIGNMLAACKTLRSLNQDLRIAVINHTRNMIPKDDHLDLEEIIPILTNAIEIVSKGGEKKLKQYERDLGWE